MTQKLLPAQMNAKPLTNLQKKQSVDYIEKMFNQWTLVNKVTFTGFRTWLYKNNNSLVTLHNLAVYSDKESTPCNWDYNQDVKYFLKSVEDYTYQASQDILFKNK